MKQELIPTYRDFEDFNEDSLYPCNTQYMVYNGMLHKYFLTEEALAYNNIDVERKYVSDSPNKMREFIEKVTKKVYDYIRYKSGWQNFQVQMYRIATSQNSVCGDKYSFRKEFENILLYEAKWLINNGDSAEYSFANMEQGQVMGINPQEEWRNNLDISPEVKRSLEYLGLSRWFTLAPNIRLDNNKY